ncbi:MAG: SpoIIE family protein phosphatase, partial [Acidobacteria bacterium]|nr:SpoIIE family protein phosphatase [Acidobacteriota bacterium]
MRTQARQRPEEIRHRRRGDRRIGVDPRQITDHGQPRAHDRSQKDASADERFLGATGIMGVGSLMAVPLWDGGNVLGLLYADASFARAAFTEDDLRLLSMLGNVAAIQMRNASLIGEKLVKERLMAEALAAAEIQRGCFPDAPPAVPGYQADGRSRPCHEVGGDFFDFVDVGNGRHVCMLGDVAGKGMGAAILMSMIHAVFHELVKDGPPILELARRLNGTVLRHAPSNRFVTLVLAELDATAHRVTVVNCGHAPAPLVAR